MTEVALPFFDARSSVVHNRHRIDIDLLENGHVHRFTTRAALDAVVERIRPLGYLIHEIRADTWHDERAMHRDLAAHLEFPNYYGHNLDAFNDVLRDIAVFSYGSDPSTTGTVLVLTGFDTFRVQYPQTAQTLLDMFAVQAHVALLGLHPMLCLVESTHVFEPVGATELDSA